MRAALLDGAGLSRAGSGLSMRERFLIVAVRGGDEAGERGYKRSSGACSSYKPVRRALSENIASGKELGAWIYVDVGGATVVDI